MVSELQEETKAIGGKTGLSQGLGAMLRTLCSPQSDQRERSLPLLEKQVEAQQDLSH